MSIGPFEFEILMSLANRPDDAYGLSLRDRLSADLKRSISIGAIYAGVERLERKKLISSWWSEPGADRGARRKRLYKIESDGRRAAQDFQRRFNSGCAPELITAGA